MVGRYIRKTERQSWSEQSMRLAIESVTKGEMGWLAASKQFDVPSATLRRRAQNKRVLSTSKGMGRYASTFPVHMEKQLVEHIKTLEMMLFGMTTSDLRKIAYQFAELNHIPHRFSHITKQAGWEWLKGFRLRNPEISLRIPEATSFARAQGFNKPQIVKFFHCLENVISKNNITPNNIYNMDESGLSSVQKPQKIFASKGRKQVGAITSAERGTHTTVVCCMSALGVFIPPALIFSRKNFKAELFDDAPPGTLGLVQESGWMVGELFLKWLKHFVKYSHASPQNKILLILDGHGSHKFLAALEYAKQNGVILLCLPAHCTHRIQPLDVSFFGPLTTYFNQEITTWLKNNPGRTVTQFQIAKLFSSAYGKAATIAIASAGFAKCGIFPVNPDIFPEHLFTPSIVTYVAVDKDTENIAYTEISQNQNVPGTSGVTNISAVECSSFNSPEVLVPLVEISPLPSAQNGSKRKRRKQTPSILTSSPFIEEIKQKNEEKLQQEQRKLDKKAAKVVKKKILIDENERQEIKQKRELKLQEEQRKLDRKAREAAKTKILIDDDDSNDDALQCLVSDDEDDASCLYCNEVYSRSKSREKWIQCQTCRKWCHIECAGVSYKIKIFCCELCA